MKTPVRPKSLLGTAAFVLSTGFVILLFLRYGLELPLPKGAIGAEGAAGLIAAAAAYIRCDRSVAVLYSVTVGLAGIFWAIVELYFPY